MKNPFKRKKVEIESYLPILVDYIEKAHKLKVSDTQIMQSFLEKGYPKDLIIEAFKLNLQQEEKMAKKEEYEDEEIEDEEEEEEEAEEEEEDEKKPKKKVKVKPQEKQPTVQDILMNHEQRLQNLEAKFFRLQNA